jgi:predicted amidophosphoribosyltransferase
MIKQFGSAALNFLFPSKCILCSAFINPENNRYDIFKKPVSDSKNLVNIFEKTIKPYVCKDCIKKLKPVRSPICPVCGEMFQGMADEDHLCKRCIKTDRNFTKARAGGIYTGILKSLIHKLKYAEKITAAKPLSVFLFYSYLKFLMEKNSIILRLCLFI